MIFDFQEARRSDNFVSAERLKNKNVVMPLCASNIFYKFG
jgi:hypothetical protein